MPLWRKILSALFLGGALVIFLYAIKITDLTTLIDSGGVSSTGESFVSLYLYLAVALLGFIACVGRRSAPIAGQQTPVKRRKLGKRTLAAAIVIVMCIPLTIFAGITYLGNRHYNITALAVLAECMLPFFMVFEGRKPKARELVVIAVLCAIGVAGRCCRSSSPSWRL